MSRIISRSLLITILVLGCAAALGYGRALAAGPWYVATTGNDGNDCLSPATACATINSAIGRASSGDTINVATGTYTGIGNEVVSVNQNVVLSGGWNDSFTSKTGMSTLDGQGVRRGATVFSTATMDGFLIQHGTLFNTGGGIANVGTLTLANSLVSNNSTDFGGGISNSGTLVLNNSTVSGNSAGIFGGGILNSGTLTINSSTISGNTSTQFGGGGIANSGGILTLNNSTVSGNSTNDSGGGLLNAGGPTGTITLNYTTVSHNVAVGMGGGVASFSSTGSVTVNSSIIAGNQIGPGGINDFAADCHSSLTLVSQGYNLTGSDTGCDPLGGTGDVTVAPASVFTSVLSALADHGGATQTHALFAGPGNPALDAITGGTNGCGAAPFDADQRGITRPQGTQCDIGAFELQANGGGPDIVIDIVPNSVANVINLRSIGTVPVAILSTTDFDARAMVNKSSLTFGATGDESSFAFCGTKRLDVNRDGIPDLICYFTIQLTAFQLNHHVGILKGNTVDGASFEASDMVRIVNK